MITKSSLPKPVISQNLSGHLTKFAYKVDHFPTLQLVKSIRPPYSIQYNWRGIVLALRPPGRTSLKFPSRNRLSSHIRNGYVIN